MANITVNNIKVKTIIGTTKKERKTKQPIFLSFSFEYDADKPSQSDELKDAVDYFSLYNKVIKKTKASKYFLLEKLASELVVLILENQLITKVSLSIKKPNALPCKTDIIYKLVKHR